MILQIFSLKIMISANTKFNFNFKGTEECPIKSVVNRVAIQVSAF